MTYGIKSLRKLQFYRETTAGIASTIVTFPWRGEGVIQDDLTTVFPNEDIGIMGGVDRSYIPSLAASLALSATPATFEQLPYVGEMGVKSTTGGTSDTTGTDYIYDYLFATTSQNTPGTYTIQGGDNAQEEVISYCYLSDFTLSGKINEAAMMAGTVKGRQVSTLSQFTTGIAIPEVEEILFNKGKLYIDSSTGTIGGTTMINVWLDMSMKVTTGFKGQQTGDGNLYFSFVKQVKPVITLDLTFEMDGSLVVAEKAAWRAGSAMQIRMQFNGSTLATTGSVFGTKALRIDLAGKWSKFSALNDDGGDDTVVASFQVGYDASAALYADMKIANLLGTLT